MKLKYYLRGIGIGVIVATLIMTVSSVIHNNNLSDETIIKEAMKLGMIMPESTDDKDGLWGSNTEIETEKASQDVSEDGSVDESEDVSETDSEDVQNSESTQSSEDEEDVETVDVGAITIYDTDGARHVSEKLMSEGLVESAVDFRSYLADNGYAKKIRSGYFEIPMGSTYEEICDIIIRK